MQKLDLIREAQIGEFEASIQPRIEEEKPKQEKRKGKQPIIHPKLAEGSRGQEEEKKRIKMKRGREDEGQYKKPRKAQNKQLAILN